MSVKNTAVKWHRMSWGGYHASLSETIELEAALDLEKRHWWAYADVDGAGYAMRRNLKTAKAAKEAALELAKVVAKWGKR